MLQRSSDNFRRYRTSGCQAMGRCLPDRRYWVGLLSGTLLSVMGCVGPEFARYPTAMTLFPHAENMAYQRQDPFPDPDIGPSTDSTPRGYDRPRSEPRKAAEQKLMQGLPVGPEAVPPGPPQSGLQRPRAVY